MLQQLKADIHNAEMSISIIVDTLSKNHPDFNFSVIQETIETLTYSGTQKQSIIRIEASINKETK